MSLFFVPSARPENSLSARDSSRVARKLGKVVRRVCKAEPVTKTLVGYQTKLDLALKSLKEQAKNPPRSSINTAGEHTEGKAALSRSAAETFSVHGDGELAEALARRLLTKVCTVDFPGKQPSSALRYLANQARQQRLETDTAPPSTELWLPTRIPHADIGFSSPGIGGFSSAETLPLHITFRISEIQQ